MGSIKKTKQNKKHGISFHCYADNSQIYIPVSGKCESPLKVLLDCLFVRLFNLNKQKTEVIVFGPCNLYEFGPLEINLKKPLRGTSE